MIAICTLTVGECVTYGHLTNANKLEYCQKNGYEFVNCDHVLDHRATSIVQQACWSKFVLMKELINIEKYNHVVWMDNDMWIFNMDLKLENLLDNEHLLFTSQDGQGLNLGVIALRSCPESKELLIDWLLRDKWLNHMWSESMAVNEWVNEGNWDKVKLIDRQIWNTFFGEARPCNILHLVGETQGARKGFFEQCHNKKITG